MQLNQYCFKIIYHKTKWMKINVLFIHLKKGQNPANQTFEKKEIINIGKESKNISVKLRNQWCPKLVVLKD